MKAISALCAMAFAVTFIALVVIFGSETVRIYALLSALLGCASQYLIQFDRYAAHAASSLLAIAGFTSAVMALVLF
ncbi:hypothetical protein [Hoeflea poritis]|uniref:Uncharacterized protein n=1 Tax=Hoeflea poritis TaxID=2993659 RepID=A0ABT4VN10_9HYPH|nr:hypothetical protein [Hoeflea poritis]MDA4845994.1 hypothetical protein [Hoeflea poritis]